MLSLRDRGVVPCDRALALIQAKLEHVDRRVAALLEFRQELVTVQREAADRATEGRVCGVIEQHQSHQTVESLRLATGVLSHRPARAREG